MVVEDDESTLSGYLEFLRSAGFDPAGVGDGAEALRMAFEHPPAAVVTDITLPGMSSFALATALHHDSRTRDVPVIGLTGHSGVDVRGHAAECRMRAVPRQAVPARPSRRRAAAGAVGAWPTSNPTPGPAPGPLPRDPHRRCLGRIRPVSTWSDGPARVGRFRDYDAYDARVRQREARLDAEHWIQVGSPTLLPDDWRGPIPN